MRGLTTRETTSHSFVRSALMLIACVLVAALLAAPFAMNHTGSAGPLGLAGAAIVCLFAAFLGDAVSLLLMRIGQPLAGAMAGMMVRMFPPLTICVVMAATRQAGREHLYFIFYLLAFYLVTLAVETWVAVKRASDLASPSSGNSKN